MLKWLVETLLTGKHEIHEKGGETLTGITEFAA
jgi:hypothetical protein